MSIQHLPSELRKIILDLLEHEDYYNTILSSKLFYSSLTFKDRQARKSVQACVLYHKNDYLRFHMRSDIVLYAYIHNRNDLLEKYKADFELDKTEVYIKTGNLQLVKENPPNPFFVSGNTLTAIRYGQIAIVKFLFKSFKNNILRDDHICLYLAEACTYERYDIRDFLCQMWREDCPRNFIFFNDFTLFHGFIFTQYVFEKSKLLTLKPEITIRLINSGIVHSKNALDYEYFNFNEFSIENIKLLDFKEEMLKFIFKQALQSGYLPVLKWFVDELGFEIDIDDRRWYNKKNLVFFLIERKMKFSKTNLISFVCSNSDQFIRLYNRFPNLRDELLEVRKWEPLINFFPPQKVDLLTLMKSKK